MFFFQRFSFRLSTSRSLLVSILYSKTHEYRYMFLLLSVAICCYLLLFVAVWCYLMLFVVIHCPYLLLLVIDCCYSLSLFVAICYYLLLFPNNALYNGLHERRQCQPDACPDTCFALFFTRNQAMSGQRTAPVGAPT